MSAEEEAGARAAEAEEKAKAADGEAPEGEERKRKKPKWLPLESNPDILNGFMERVGVQGGWAFADVLGLDPELLAFAPQPALAVCLLFPSKAVRRPRLEALEGQQDARRAPASTFYLTQHKEFGNACGTIAAVHAIANLVRGGSVQLLPSSPIAKFVSTAEGMSPDDAGRALADASELHEASDDAARSAKSQTKTPGRDDKVDGHFVVFLEVEGRVVELDGCMGFPIDHGATSPAGFLQDAAKIIREEFVARAPGDPNFSVMALGPGASGASSSGGAGAGAAATATYEAQVEQLAAMGFPADQALEALRAVGGDLDAAVGVLCG